MTVAQLIVNLARQYNLDPQAVLAVARGEGGVNYGAIGDQGTSYGPFQLHVGGALPAGRDAAWANSPEGLEYAIRKMAESGAAGLTGPAAIHMIISRFERPADVGASVRAAVQRYGGIAGSTSRTSRIPRTPAVKTHAKTDANSSQRLQATQQAIRTLLGIVNSTPLDFPNRQSVQSVQSVPGIPLPSLPLVPRPLQLVKSSPYIA